MVPQKLKIDGIFLSYIERLNYKFKKNKTLIGKIHIIKNKKKYFFFDVGEPPKKLFQTIINLVHYLLNILLEKIK